LRFNIDWSDIVDPAEHMSADILYSAFVQKFLKTFENSFPVKKLKMTNKHFLTSHGLHMD